MALGFVGSTLREGSRRFMEALEVETAATFRGWLIMLRDLPGMRPEIRREIDTLLAPPAPGVLIIMFSVVSVTIHMAISIPLGFLQRRWQMEGNREALLERLDAQTAATMLRRRIITEGRYSEDMADQGWSAERQLAIYRLSAQFLTDTTLAETVRRGLSVEGGPVAYLERIGYSTADADLLVTLAQRIPEASLVMDAWRQRRIDDTTAYRHLERLGFTGDTRQLILDTARPILNPSEAWSAINRGLVSEEALDSDLDRSGYSAAQHTAARELAYAPLGLSEVRDLYNRGQLSPIQAHNHLTRAGLRDADATAVIELFSLIPGPSDLVRFAVREVFSPEVVRDFELDADLPEEFVQHAATVGLNAEWARAYWRAHWTLPSVSQGYEMLHRGVIDEGQLDLLLRTQDINPFWREKLKEISYDPYTRVDVRRMRATGVLSPEEVKKAYLDQGYDEARAQKLTEWVEAEYVQDARDLTKSEMVLAYKRGVLSAPEIRGFLADLGYQADEVEVLVAIADWQTVQAEIADRVEVIHIRYVQREIDEVGMASELGALNLPSTTEERYKAKWRIERQKNITLPSWSLLKELYNADAIKKPEVTRYLTALRYPPEVVTWMIQTLDEVEEAKAPRKLTVADNRARLKAGIIDYGQFKQALVAIGYTEADADRLTELERKKAEVK